MNKLPFLTTVRGTSEGVIARFRRPFKIAQREVEQLAKRHDFHFYLHPHDPTRFCVEPRVDNSRWGIDLHRKEKKITAVRVTINEECTPRHRDRVMEFLKELAPKPN